MGEQAQVLRCAELVQQLAGLHQRAAATALRGFGVSEAGSGVLWLLGTQAQVSMGAVAQQLSCDPSNVTLLAAALEDLGLVQRVADPDDRRRRLLRLTEHGRAARTAMCTAVHDASPLSALEDDQLEALMVALRQVRPG